MANQPIKIDVVTGGSHGHHLMHCYFEEIDESDGYAFRDPNGDRIQAQPSPVCSGADFSFDYGGLQWTVHKFKISKKHLDAKGRWTAKRDDNDDPESGTFQAQAGGGAGERKASASTAA